MVYVIKPQHVFILFVDVVHVLMLGSFLIFVLGLQPAFDYFLWHDTPLVLLLLQPCKTHWASGARDSFSYLVKGDFWEHPQGGG